MINTTTSAQTALDLLPDPDLDAARAALGNAKAAVVTATYAVQEILGGDRHAVVARG